MKAEIYYTDHVLYEKLEYLEERVKNNNYSDHEYEMYLYYRKQLNF